MYVLDMYVMYVLPVPISTCITNYTRDQCYDFLKYFRRNNRQKFVVGFSKVGS
jgi:hypothetical protein